MTLDPDHQALLDRLLEMADASGLAPLVVATRAAEWLDRIPVELPARAGLARCVNELLDALQTRPSQASRLAAAGLLHVVDSPVAPAVMTELGARAHAFVLGLVRHRVRGVQGARIVEPPPLIPRDRDRAEEIFAGILDEGAEDDPALIAAVRDFCANPGLPVESAFVRRLLRNAEFLITVLQSPGWPPADRARARAALAYLVKEDDSIDDSLGLMGYIDDAWILDSAVSAIEPARLAWIQLLDAASILPDLADDPGVSAPVLGEAALLSEPWVSDGPLSRALFVPTSGATPLLLAVAAYLYADPAEPLICVATRVPRARRIVADLRLDGQPLETLMPVSTWAPGGALQAESGLVLVDGLAQAEALLSQHGRRISLMLVDVDAALAAPQPSQVLGGVRAVTAAPSRDPDLLAAYSEEAGSIPRLSQDEEVALSESKIAARAEGAAVVHSLGALARKLLPDPEVPVDGMTDEDLASALAGLAPLARELDCPAETATAVRSLRGCIRRVDRAVDGLTRANLRLVMWVARRYPNSQTHFLDMVQEGNLGLMRAARLFDHRKGKRFATYAILWIRQSIAAFLTNHSRTIRIPESAIRSLRKLTRTMRELDTTLGRNPSNAEVAQEMGVEVEAVVKLVRLKHDLERGTVTLDGSPGGQDELSLRDRLPDPTAAQPVETIYARQMAEEAHRLLHSLGEKEAHVLRLRFGIGEDKRHSLKEIGQVLGVSAERARQIEQRALARLRIRHRRAKRST